MRHTKDMVRNTIVIGGATALGTLGFYTVAMWSAIAISWIS